MKRRAEAANLHIVELGSTGAPIKADCEFFEQTGYAFCAWLLFFLFPQLLTVGYDLILNKVLKGRNPL